MSDCIAYVDESSKGSLFVFGGLTSDAPHWELLTQEWKAVLASPPEIPYFKFNNPHRLTANQHGDKIVALIKIINSHVMRADAAIVNTGEYEVYFANLIGASYDNPLHFGYMQTLQQCALHCPVKDARIDFIFDTMNDMQMAELRHGFQLFRDHCPNAEVKARLEVEPSCQDDKTVPALQAADLWAGVVNASCQPDAAAQRYLRMIAIPNRAFLWEQGELAELLGRSVRRAPDITSRKYYETKKQRKKRLSVRLKSVRNESR